MKWTRVSAPALGALGLLVLAGCGPGVGTLSGTVKFNGEPVTEGQLTAYGPDGQVVTAYVNEDGTYRLDNVPTGAVRLIYMGPGPAEANTGEIVKVKGKEGKAAAAPAAPRAGKFPIPARYGDPGTSGLTTTVKKGENKYDVAMTP